MTAKMNTLRGWRGLCLSIVASLMASAVAAADYDLVIANGRVMDPETGFDEVATIGVKNGRIEKITKKDLKGERRIDASDLVVAPGFIDLHAHGQNIIAQGLQARDGVTTALEQEIGVYPVKEFYEAREGKSRLNFGASVSHQGIRIKVKTGRSAGHTPSARSSDTDRLQDLERWAMAPMTEEELKQGLDLYREEAAAGGLGLGLAHEYTPGADRKEIYRFMETAAALNHPVFTHVRMARHPNTGGLFEMMQEVIANAAVHGGALHICHVTSKGLGDTALILEAVDAARENGLDITAEAYPYAAGSTGIGTALFNEGWQDRWNADYGDVEWPPTGERLTKETFERYRREQPGADVVFHMIPEEAMKQAIAHPDVIIASDGMTFEGGVGHPRGAGAYARVLGRFVREEKLLTLMEALAKMTLLPAKRMEGVAPAMRRKGRLQEGMDADITIFDPETVIDRATYKDSMQPSQGVLYVLVGGVEVVTNAALNEEAFPGKGIMSSDKN